MEKWVGTFSSQAVYSLFVSGTLELFLPENMESISEVEAVFKYTGFYRSVPELKLKFIGDSNTLKAQHGEQEFILLIKSRDKNKIFGNYKSVNPGDHGMFNLKKE